VLGKDIKRGNIINCRARLRLMRRPPSYSDSYIVIGNYKHVGAVAFNGIDATPLTLRTPESASINLSAETDLVDGASIADSTDAVKLTEEKFGGLCRKDILAQQCEHICENLLRFVFHITLISVFETIFFFNFVSIDEDRGILATADFYMRGVISKCADFTYNETAVANYILLNLVNVSQVLEQGYVGLTMRTTYNIMLRNLAWKYVGGLCGLTLCLIVVSLACKFKTRWIYIIVENIVLVAMLGLYEFMFFETIVKKYKTETPQEISSLFVQGLQKTCGLLL